MSTHKAKVLVMDDEDMVRGIASEMLYEIGHEVIGAKDGAEAIQAYQAALNTTAPIDVVIMDLTIPGGMGGEVAVQRILTLHPEAKVIVSSGYSNDPVMANFQNYGFCAAIVKPYQLTELAETINQVVG